MSSNQRVGQRFLKHIDNSERWQEDLIRAIRQGPQIPAGLLESSPNIARFQKGIRNLLRFPEIENRRDRIPDAFKRTFEWIYSDPQETQRPWNNFIEWLENDKSLYWITGKAGSGKSTLLKFIYYDSRTKEHLQKWASPDPLVTAAFFFWNSGTKLEMSQEGLLRSILYDTLYQCPELTVNCFPEYSEMFELFGIEPNQSIQWPALLRGTKRLIKAGKQRKFFLFIDGLDEFDGDHTELIKLINHLTDYQNIKICVSSRPWNVFEDAFKNSPNLMLQDLTQPDFVHFIKTNFDGNPGYAELAEEDPAFAHTLIEDIARKASGIFLWVSLVVRSLLIGLTNGDRIFDLKKRLESLPPDLEGLFRRMLDNLDPLYLEHGSQLFQIIRAARVAPTLLCLSFADEPDPESVFRFPVTSLTTRELHSRAERMRRRLNSRCRGLLELATHQEEEDEIDDALRKIAHASALSNCEDEYSDADRNDETNSKVDPAKTQGLACSKVEYLHRTVRDFITRDDVWAEIKAAAPSYNPHLALCRAYLYQFKTLNMGFSDLNSHSLTITMRTDVKDGKIWDAFTWCVQYAVDSEKTTYELPIKLLDELGRVAGICRPKPNTHVGLFRPSGLCWCAAASDEATGAFLPLAVALQLTSYLKAKLPHSQALKQNQKRKSLLHVAIEDYQTFLSLDKDRPACVHNAPNEGIIRLLLEHGEDPNQSSPSFPTPWQCAAKKQWSEGLIDCFLQHGADPKLAKQQQKRKGPFRNHLRGVMSRLI